MKTQNFHVIENPRVRIPTIDAGRFRNNKTSMIGFLEMDVTNLRKNIREIHNRNGDISFTSCMIKLISDCIAENTNIQAALLTDRKKVIFDDVDISIAIERKLNNEYFPFPLIIRSANNKSAAEISQEIKKEIDKPLEEENDFFMPNNPRLGKFFLDLFYFIPSGIRVRLMENMIRSPFRAKQVIGTIGFATVNMTGRLSGWVFPSKNPYSLYIALGSVTKKPVVIKNEIQIREVLNMTVIFDHNIIDGTPARSFMNTLVTRIEQGKFNS